MFEDIRSPDQVQHEIYAQMEAIENRGFDRIGQHPRAGPGVRPAAASPPAGCRPPPARADPGAGPPPRPRRRSADRIAELHRLHTQGAITDAEFEAKKAQLLDQM